MRQLLGNEDVGGCYTIPTGLCYDCGFRALTVAPALRLPGDLAPLEGPGVTDQQESVAGLPGHSLLTAFPLKCGSLGRWPCVRWGVRESVTDLFRHSLPAKGGIEGCWSGCLCCSNAEAQTDRRASTAFIIDLRVALLLDQGTIGLHSSIGPDISPTAPSASCHWPWGHPHSSISGRQGTAVWVAG